MKKDDSIYVRVIPQRTITPRSVSLVAEESKGTIQKGSVVTRINIGTIDKMERPLTVRVTNGGGRFPMLKRSE